MENLTYFLERYEPIRNTHRIVESSLTDNFWELCYHTLNLDRSICDVRKDLRFGIYFSNGNYRERRTLFAPIAPCSCVLGIFLNNGDFEPIRNITELSVFYQRFHKRYNDLQLKGVRKWTRRNVLKNYLYFSSAHQTGLTPFYQVVKTTSSKQPDKVNWQEEGF